MADLLKNLFGGSKPAQKATQAPVIDDDFADFAGAPDPVPEAEPASTTVLPVFAAPTAALTGVPYTKWYNVHERHSISEFKAEGIILMVTAFVVLFHIIGARLNRSKARTWIRANAPVLKEEFALVGFGGVATLDHDVDVNKLLKEKSLFEYATYATGRQNVAFVDFNLTLAKRFNPILTIIETVASVVSEMFAPPSDHMEAVLYPFDGKESLTVPPQPTTAEARVKDAKSTYENFVWAIVNKDRMQNVREDRYDVTLTSTKDHPKLPAWLSVMSENSEVTTALLTAELISAVVEAGEGFDYLIVTDQPIERPKTLDEAQSRKRIYLKYRLPADGSYEKLAPLLSHFVRLPDVLVKSAQLRPEVTKKIRATREAIAVQMRKAEEEERNEERLAEKERARKAKRDVELKGLDAKAQKKFLEKEKEKEMRRSKKRMTMRA